jgi:endonuclease III
MQSLFSKFEVTPAFVLEKHAADPLFWETLLRDLGRQVSNAKNVILAAATTLRLKHVPRNYTNMVLNYKGVGPKMALVTVHSSYNDVVSFYFFS